MIKPSAGRSPDLLVHGDDEPPLRLGRRARLAALLALLTTVLAAAGVLAASSVREDRAADALRRRAAVEADATPRLSLLPDQPGTPRGGPRPTGLQLVVANDGPADVRLASGTVAVEGWRVLIPNRRLRSGSSVRVELVPPAGCAADLPRRLALQIRLASGRTVPSVLDLADAPLLYGGHLEEAVAALRLTCGPGPAGRATAPAQVGDGEARVSR